MTVTEALPHRWTNRIEPINAAYTFVTLAVTVVSVKEPPDTLTNNPTSLKPDRLEAYRFALLMVVVDENM